MTAPPASPLRGVLLLAVVMSIAPRYNERPTLTAVRHSAALPERPSRAGKPFPDG
jgi:hypothetical protein